MFGIPTPAGLSLGLVLKIGALVLALGLGGWGGCSAQAHRDQARFDDQAAAHAKVIAAKNLALTNAATALRNDAAQLSALAGTLRQVSETTQRNARLAEEQRARADRLAEEARRDRRLYERRLADLDTQRAAAAASSPACRAQLEAPLCAELH